MVLGHSNYVILAPLVYVYAVFRFNVRASRPLWATMCHSVEGFTMQAMR